MTQAIFLSYASQDADAARRICDALRAAGLEVWFDQSELRGGDAWDASIRKQIKECALFVAVISANTDARPEGYFRLEWKLAVDRSHLMADDQPFFVPVILGDLSEPTARVPEKFRERQWMRLNDEGAMKAFADRVSKLVKSVSTQPNLDPGLPLRGLRDAAVTSGASGEQVTNTSASPSARPPSAAGPTSRASRRTAIIATVAIIFALACAAAAWFMIERQRKEAFVTQGLAKIEDLSRSTKFMEAYRLAGEVERAGGAAQLTDAIRQNYTRAVDVASNPEGATIAFREYKPQANDAPWIEIGVAPMSKMRVPRGVLEWRATLLQRQTHTLTALTTTGATLTFSLPAPGSKEADMLPVPAGESEIGGMTGIAVSQGVKLNAFAIDRTEVTNQQFAAFVKAGGYTREEFWQQPFQDGAKVLSFAAAIVRFKDATGRAGPATWRFGSYPEGEGDLPVRGISWHEASAYAAFASKSLPTVYHWYFADSADDIWTLLPALMPSAKFEAGGTNAGAKAGPRAAAASRNISRFGAVDMAGNVREWISNPTDKGRRIAVGGSWLEVTYQYKYGTPYSAFERPLDVGFRCMSKTDAAANDPAFASVTERKTSDAKTIAKVSDAEYAIYVRMLGSGTVALNTRIESTDNSKPHWTRLKVSFTTGYSGGGGERMNAYLYLPKNAAPPFQTVIFFPNAAAFENKRSYDDIAESAPSGWTLPEMLVRGGRAVLYPIWQGSFERFVTIPATNAFFREAVPRWASELRQAVEFLRSRPELDANRTAYYGNSLGAAWAPHLLATEPRVQTAILFAGGRENDGLRNETLPPELDSATYAPRLKVPVLMLNGRDDIRFPYETSQVPLFNLLGSPPNKKKHNTYPGGHGVLGWYDEIVKDSHAWLDEQFGPVKPVASGGSK
jgi:formylglycine-generating enzyme required for sulfatase activity/dienelactone hydrolase